MASTAGKDLKMAEEIKQGREQLQNELRKIIIGQEAIIEELIISLLSRGHCLLVGVPGLAKTLLISTLAEIFDLSFKRIQFTPDLMPSDITGTEILEEDRSTGKKAFRYVKGPIFANIILADEINRTPPKTQAALLQAMQEREVSAAGETLPLPDPFFVLATQNPIEQEGTYPLPEAQLDRFMFSLWIDYPSRDEEVCIVQSTTGGAVSGVKSVISAKKLTKMQDLVRKVPVSDNVVEYAVDLVRKTRPEAEDAPDFIKSRVSWGAGPRAGQYLVLGAKARCVLDGRLTPEIDDIKRVARPVLRHRIVTNFNAEAENVKSTDLIEKLIT